MVKFTKRELDILECLKEGLKSAQMAEKLSISTNTVKDHLTKMYRKYKVSSRAALLSKYYQRMGA